MTNKSERQQNKGANKVQAEAPKTPGGAFPVTTPHLLYRDWHALKVDGRSFYAKRKKELISKLLENFKLPIPGPAEILANITASNLLLALRMEGMLHTGTLAPSAFQDYLRLTNSNSANLVRLWTMAKEAPAAEKTPILDEYLAGLKEDGRVIAAQPIESEPNPGPQEAPAV
jgi:hypothetical protein